MIIMNIWNLVKIWLIKETNLPISRASPPFPVFRTIYGVFGWITDLISNHVSTWKGIGKYEITQYLSNVILYVCYFVSIIC